MNTPLGQAIPRVDGRLKVTGRARYASDVSLPGMVHAALVTSTVARGRIALLDTAAAEQAPGVLAVLTHHNAPRLRPLDYPQPGQPPASAGNGFRPLQDDLVRYSGQVVALVVADSPQQAVHAAQLVVVSYDREAHQVAVESAGEPFAPPSGSAGEALDYRRGSVREALEAAEVTLSRRYATAPVHHNPIGPFAAVAAWEGDRLTIHDATQGVCAERKGLAAWLDLDPAQVRVVSAFVGGAFGAGLRVNVHSVLAAMAARRVGRPVKLVLSRAQMYTLTGHRPQSRHDLVLGAHRDGRLLAICHDVLHTTSRFDEHIDLNTELTRMLYACPHLAACTRLQRLDIDTPCHMRAPSHANAAFALESALDELAVALSMDPLELRLRNHADRDPDSGLPWSSKSLRQCYARGAERIGWQRRDPEPRSLREGRWLLGLGMASAAYPVHRSGASARARAEADGRVRVASAAADIGPGTYTVMSQIAADALGLDVSRVSFELGDSDLPKAPLQGGSMTVASVGPAVREACRRLRAELVGEGEPLTTEAIARTLARRGVDHLEVGARTPGGSADGFAGHAFGAHFVRVRVDQDSGEVRLDRWVGVFAAGRILNPATARSQMLGGLVMGLGQALLERTQFDPASGRIINADLGEYRLPVCADPGDLEVIFVEEDDPHVNVLGAKGIGEIALVGVAPALANAVYHATGVRVRELPIRPELLTA